MQKRKISIILSLIGRTELLINEFARIVQELQSLKESYEVIIVSDGPHWQSLPMYQMLFTILPNTICVISENEMHLPAVLYNRGIRKATGKYLLFCNLHTEKIEYRIKLFNDWIENNGDTKDLLYIRSNNASIFPSDQNRYGFLQNENFYSLDDIFIKKDRISQIGLFNESPILQEHFDREFLIRASRNLNFTEIGLIQRNSKSNNEFIFRYNIPLNIIKRYIARCGISTLKGMSISAIDQSFVNDLKEDDYKKIKNYFTVVPQLDVPYTKKYKILILGGYWDFHHIQICFLNYLEHLAGKGFSTYYTAFEFSSTPEDIDGNDLVIFTRCRSDNMLSLINYCIKKNIPTIYMIDDNWMTIANDYPTKDSIFVPENPAYENFLEAVSKCKTTWVFTEKIIEDLDGYANHFTKFKISIEPNVFRTDNIRPKTNVLYVGFSGSLRYDDSAFRALARIANKHKNVCVILVGYLSPVQEKLFRNKENVIRAGFMSYPIYSKFMSKLNPDLLIAPLKDTRTDASKCCNKYIESAIVHAACVYSKVEPYTQVIKDGINGFFVENEDENSWFQKLDLILSDLPKLRKVQDTAYKDIITHYTVQSLIPDFTKKINSIVEDDYYND